LYNAHSYAGLRGKPNGEENMPADSTPSTADALCTNDGVCTTDASCRVAGAKNWGVTPPARRRDFARIRERFDRTWGSRIQHETLPLVRHSAAPNRHLVNNSKERGQTGHANLPTR